MIDQLQQIIAEADPPLQITCWRWLEPGRELARRKWLIRSDPESFGWIVTAPSGRQRWYACPAAMRLLCPMFVIDEQNLERYPGGPAWLLGLWAG